ncbi:response regulator [Alteromonadaceae bacterium M269]|nr:response regulator [Alteromonadaceae bacterium M269]
MKELSVLIVDDSEIDRYILTRQLRESGVKNIFEQDDGSSAIKQLEEFEANSDLYEGKFPPVIIFLDINMPNLGGFGFLKKFAEVRKELGLESCVIMMYSSSERQEDKENAYQFDFVKDYIVKGELTSEDLKRKLTPFC